MNTIQITTFEGCDSAGKLIADLEKLQKNELFSLKVTVVPSSEQAAELGLYGSPTIYINGVEYQKDSNGNPGFY